MAFWKERRKNCWLVREKNGRGDKARTVETVRTSADADMVIGRLRTRARATKPTHPGRAIPLEELLTRWARAKADDLEPYVIDEVSDNVQSVFDALGWETTADAKRSDIEGLKTAADARWILAILRWASARLDAYIDPRAIAPFKGLNSAPVEDRELMPDSVYAMILERATEFGDNVTALVHYLSTYGPRPITAAKLKVEHFDAKRQTLLPMHKGWKRPMRHPLFQETVDLFVRITKGRPADAPLFLHPNGDAWPLRCGKGLAPIPNWYRNRIGCVVAEEHAGVYQLKRLAITRMLAGRPPWRTPLTVADARLFTGHKTRSQLLRYAQTNMERARFLVGLDSDTSENRTASR